MNDMNDSGRHFHEMFGVYALGSLYDYTFACCGTTPLLDVWGHALGYFSLSPMSSTCGWWALLSSSSLQSEASPLGRGEKSGDLHTLYTPTQFANLHFNFPKFSRYFKYPIPNLETQI